MTPHTRWSSFRHSFQFTLLVVFTLLTAVIAIPLCTLYISSEIQEKRETVSDNLRLLAQQMAESARLPLYAGNRVALQQLARQAEEIPEIRSVMITAADGGVLAEVLFSGPEADSSGPEGVVSSTVDVYGSHLADSVESALSGSHDTSRALIGRVRMERGTADLSRTIRQVIAISICSAILFWVVVTFLCYLVLRRVTRSFNTLVQGITTMQDGDFSLRIAIDSDDEAGRAARAVNNLANALQQRSEEVTRLHEERLNLERQMLHAQKLESLGIMAGGIAHDYNNLLQSILGNIELASLKLDPASASHSFIANAMNSGKHAAHLTGLMLTYVGRGFINKKELNLNAVIRENADMLQTAATTAITTELCLGEDVPLIRADEANIQQVVMNLIINAAEAIEGRPGHVRITTGVQVCDHGDLAGSVIDEKPAPGRFVFLEVEDNGCGMNEETLTRLFDPFFTTKFTGRGLGMSAVMGIVKSHGGALFVTSEPERGTTFRVLFPALCGAPQAETPQTVNPTPCHLLAEEDPEAEENDSSTETPSAGVALVVDDEKQVLRVGRKMVELCGYKVITAADGVEAVEKFRERADEITVVLMDLTMPNMDGITAMGEIYAIRPDARVILSSGFSEEEISTRITAQPPAGFIRKPYNMKLLDSELRRIMQGE